MNAEIAERCRHLNQQLQVLHTNEPEYDAAVSSFLQEVSLAALLEAMQNSREQPADDANLLRSTFRRIARSGEIGTQFVDSNVMALCEAGLGLHGSEDKEQFIRLMKEYAGAVIHNPATDRVQLLRSLAALLLGENLRLADASASAILSVVSSDNGAASDACKQLLGLAGQVQSDSMLSLRIADLLARILVISNQTFEACRQAGGFELILSQSRTPDLLVQLNGLELLEIVADNDNGILMLFSSGEINRLLDLAYGSANTAADPILGATALAVLQKAFVKCSQSAHVEEKLKDYSTPDVVQRFLHATLEHISSNDERQRLAALHAISGYARASAAGLHAVVNDDALMEGWLSLLNAKVEQQAICLNSIARVLNPKIVPNGPIVLAELPDDFSSSEETYNDRIRLFQNIGRIRRMSTMDYLIKCTRQPLADVKHAAYDVLRAAASQPSVWGLRELFSHTGFVEMYLDRSTEHTKEGKEWKFSVIEAIMLCPGNAILGADVIEKLRTYLRQGPFYSPPQLAEMATV